MTMKARGERLLEILRRHIPENADELTDRELVYATFTRWERHLEVPLIDPNE